MSGLVLRVQRPDDPDRARRLHQAHIEGIDRMPWPTRATIEADLVTLARGVKESGCIHLPWLIPDFGEVYVSTTSLMERDEPYRLAAELARGQYSRLRSQIADWETHGLKVAAEAGELVKQAALHLRDAILANADADAETAAEQSLRFSLLAGEQIADQYAKSAIVNRLKRSASSSVGIACNLDDAVVDANDPTLFLEVFRQVCIPVDWRRLEPRQGERDWSSLDRKVGWAVKQGLGVTIGPIIDFHPAALPDWLWLFESEPQSMVDSMLDHVGSCVRRYSKRIHVWEAVIRTNSADLLSLNEEQLVWLTNRICQAVQAQDPAGKCIVTVDQPWAEYMAKDDHAYSPYTFLDMLHRMETPLHGIGLELAVGYAPGGSFNRAMLEYSRLLDTFREIDLPLHLKLYFPSAAATGPEGVQTTQGSWRGPLDEQQQAEWAERVGQIALAKTNVERICWGNWVDLPESRWPYSGLHDAAGQPKAALKKIYKLRKLSGDAAPGG